MESKKITELMNQYQHSLEDRAKTMELWQTEKKEWLKQKLDQIVNSRDMGWFVHLNDSIVNNETVGIAFRMRPSGMFYKENDFYNEQQKLSGPLSKRGAVLNFSFTSVGEIICWVELSYIENRAERPKTKDLNSIDLKHLDESFISLNVEEFLYIIDQWEKGINIDTDTFAERQRVGFVMPSAKESPNGVWDVE